MEEIFEDDSLMGGIFCIAVFIILVAAFITSILGDERREKLKNYKDKWIIDKAGKKYFVKGFRVNKVSLEITFIVRDEDGKILKEFKPIGIRLLQRTGKKRSYQKAFM